MTSSYIPLLTSPAENSCYETHQLKKKRRKCFLGATCFGERLFPADHSKLIQPSPSIRQYVTLGDPHGLLLINLYALQLPSVRQMA